MKGWNTRLLSLALLFVVYETLTAVVAARAPDLDWFHWLELALAAAFAGRAIAYEEIGAPFRVFLTKVVPHSSGAGEDVHPKWSEGSRSSIATLVSCPICSGMWAGLFMYVVLAYFPYIGHGMIELFSIGSVLWLVIHLTELIEWAGRNQRELTGYWNRMNRYQRGEEGEIRFAPLDIGVMDRDPEQAGVKSPPV